MSNSGHDVALGRLLRPRGPVHFNLTVRHADGATVLKVVGELDIFTASRLTSQLEEVVRRGSGDAVIDLRQAEFIDSMALYILLNVQRRLRRRSRDLVVVCGEGAVRRSIELARLTDTLGVVSDLGDYELRRPGLLS
jgi:anti-sigma B factor antagonist